MKKLPVILALLFLLIFSCSRETDLELRKQTRLLIEKNEIIDLTNKLFISTDNRDWQQVKECFTDTVLLDMTSMVGGKPSTVTTQEIVDAWDKGLKALKAIHHQVGNYVVEIAENEADLFCYGIATHYLPNKTNLNVRTFVGSYDVHLVKEKDSWRINKFKYNLKYIDGNPDLEASL